MSASARRAALRWRCYDPTLEPLGHLLVAASWSTTHRVVKATKTEQPRAVPVQPVLAKILAAWKLGGYAIMRGGAPRPDDLVVPALRGGFRSRHHALSYFHGDLDRLGLRRRRQHDLRRTMISLARADGATKDILETVTHGARGDIMDSYTTLPCANVCHEVAKLRVQLIEGRVVAPRRRVPYTSGSTPCSRAARPAGRGTAAAPRSSASSAVSPRGGPGGRHIRMFPYLHR